MYYGLISTSMSEQGGLLEDEDIIGQDHIEGGVIRGDADIGGESWYPRGNKSERGFLWVGY